MAYTQLPQQKKVSKDPPLVSPDNVQEDESQPEHTCERRNEGKHISSSGESGTNNIVNSGVGCYGVGVGTGDTVKIARFDQVEPPRDEVSTESHRLRANIIMCEQNESRSGAPVPGATEEPRGGDDERRAAKTAYV